MADHAKAVASRQEIAERFNKEELHDSKLRAIQTIPGHHPDAQEVALKLEVVSSERGQSTYRPALLVFLGCRFLRVSLDLAGKAMCDDDIATALCRLDSDFKQETEAQVDQLAGRSPGGESVDQYLHFRVELIPPGGSIDVLAKAFEWR